MGETDQLKTPEQEDRDLAKVADKPTAPAESGSRGGKSSGPGGKTMKTGDIRGR